MLLYSMKALNYHASKKHHQLKFCDYKKQNQFFFNNKRIFIGRTLEVGHRIEVQNQTLESCGKDKNQDSFRFLSLRNSQVWLSSTFPSADSGKSQRCLLKSQILGREKLAHKEKKENKSWSRITYLPHWSRSGSNSRRRTGSRKAFQEDKNNICYSYENISQGLRLWRRHLNGLVNVLMVIILISYHVEEPIIQVRFQSLHLIHSFMICIYSNIEDLSCQILLRNRVIKMN